MGERRIDPDGAPERPVERVPRDGALEAGEAPAGVGAATRIGRAERELAVPRDEAQELVLRRLPPAADACP
jgi:hypothetical protein